MLHTQGVTGSSPAASTTMRNSADKVRMIASGAGFCYNEIVIFTEVNAVDRRKESKMFNQMADYYDKYRPNYPQENVN